jgi:hypothetical protein
MSYVLILTIITSFGGVDTQRQTGFDSYQSLRRAHQRPWGVAMTVRNSSRPMRGLSGNRCARMPR